MIVKVSQFSTEMGRPSTNKNFYKKYRRNSNNKVGKKFEAEAKEILAQRDLGSWYHQFCWENANHLDISSSRQKIVLPEGNIDSAILTIHLQMKKASQRSQNAL